MQKLLRSRRIPDQCARQSGAAAPSFYLFFYKEPLSNHNTVLYLHVDPTEHVQLFRCWTYQETVSTHIACHCSECMSCLTRQSEEAYLLSNGPEWDSEKSDFPLRAFGNDNVWLLILSLRLCNTCAPDCRRKSSQSAAEYFLKAHGIPKPCVGHVPAQGVRWDYADSIHIDSLDLFAFSTCNIQIDLHPWPCKEGLLNICSWVPR